MRKQEEVWSGHVKGKKRVIRNEEIGLTYLNYRESKVKDMRIFGDIQFTFHPHVEVITPLNIAPTISILQNEQLLLWEVIHWQPRSGAMQTIVESVKVTVRLVY
jgi:hypothetical protein